MLGEHFLVLVTNGLAIKPCIFTVTAHVLSSTCSSCNIHYAHTAMIVGTVLMVTSRDIGTECVRSYTGYHIPPQHYKVPYSSIV